MTAKVRGIANKNLDAAQLADVLKACLRDGDSVELEGLGVFLANDGEPPRFVPDTSPRVFIAYAIEDLPLAMRVYADLMAAGMAPWLDRKKLLPGQAWSRAIERAIETSDFFVPCFSIVSAHKKGQFPYELRHALRCADRLPLDDVFLLPIRLDNCPVPRSISAQTQYVDLFPDWDTGLNQLVSAIRHEMMARRNRRSAA
jgi:hypothetical protein